MKRIHLAIAALLLGGCASSYQLVLMPRDTGKIYYGTADDAGSGEGRISVTIENTTYNGTWVQATPDRTTAYGVGGWGGWGYGRRYGVGGFVTYDNPNGTEVKALLQSKEGAGLRCDLRSGYGTGAGMCRDDRGREYDVQIRTAPKAS